MKRHRRRGMTRLDAEHGFTHDRIPGKVLLTKAPENNDEGPTEAWYVDSTRTAHRIPITTYSEMVDWMLWAINKDGDPRSDSEILANIHQEA